MYVDDLFMCFGGGCYFLFEHAAQNPKELIDILKAKYQPRVNGDGPLTYHLGADY